MDNPRDLSVVELMRSTLSAYLGETVQVTAHTANGQILKLSSPDGKLVIMNEHTLREAFAKAQTAMARAPRA